MSSNNESAVRLFTREDNPLLCMQEFRLANEHIDVNFKVDEKLFPAHRVVLASGCPKLKAMLSKVWDPERKKDCELDKQFVNPEIVNDLLDYFYIGKVTITIDNAQLLFIAANFLCIPGLLEATGEFIDENAELSTADVVDWFRFCETYQRDSLRQKCSSFIYENYETFLNGDAFLDCPHDYLLHLFTDMKQHCSNMMINDAMLGLVIQWAMKEPTTRSNSLAPLLDAISLLEVSENLLRNASIEKVIVDSPQALEVINKAINKLSSKAENSSTNPTYHFYALGGFSHLDGCYLDSLSHLNVSTRKWDKTHDMIHPTRDFSVAHIGNKIYCFTGVQGFNPPIFSKVAKVYDTETNRWTLLRPMPEGSYFSSAVAHNGYIYVSGGSVAYNEPKADVYRYCVATNDWESVAPMLESRSGHKLLSCNQYIYALGGDEGNPIERYDPEANEWQIVGILEHFCRSDATVHQGKIYAFAAKQIEIYDPETNSIEHKRTGKHSRSAKVVSIGDHILVADFPDDCPESFAADDPFEYYTFKKYYPETGKWFRLNLHLNIARDGFQAVAIEQ